MLKIILLIVIVSGVLYFGWRYLKEEFVHSADIKFLDKEATARFLYNDGDGYVSNMSPLDLYARNSNDATHYIDRISQSAMTFTKEQKERFMDAAAKADGLLEKLSDLPGIVEIPWVFAMTKDNQYEDGLPHTRANIIFVSSNIDERSASLVKTLIHEKIHLYQRAKPEQIAKYLEANGYRRWKQRLGVPRVRSNPDLDPWIYVDPVTEKPMAAFYSSDKPTGITDVVMNDMAFEHPFEKMAYEMSDKLMREM